MTRQPKPAPRQLRPITTDPRCYDIQWIASRKFLECQQPSDHEDPHRWQGEIHGRQVEITWTSGPDE